MGAVAQRPRGKKDAMPLPHNLPRRLFAVGGALALAGSLAACGSGRTDDEGGGGDSSGGLVIGTTDKVVALDPAASYDNGSLLVENQIYQFLMVVPPGGTQPEPDAAESCSFTTPTEYTCTLKDGLTFSNDHELTAEDVAFSYQRIVDIDDPNGPASLLQNMASVAAPDEKTVVFTLKTPNDQTFPFVLGTSAGPIVDSEVFPADDVLADEDVIGSGPYAISSYRKNELVEFNANGNYKGSAAAPASDEVVLQYYSKAENLKLDIQQGEIDVAWRSLTAQDVADLRKTDDVEVKEGPGGETRYIVFNLDTMPGDDAAQKLAIRRAVAYSVDRGAIADKVYKGTYTPLYSMVPDGLPGHVDAFKETFGDAPDKAKAEAELTAAGLTPPVALNIQYNPDHYGSSSDQEYNEVKRQLEETGLFTVDLSSTEWVTYNEERTQDVYPIYQLGWFPDFPDADNYLSPFYTCDNFVASHYCEADTMDPLVGQERTTADPAQRAALIQQIQQQTTEGPLPYLPLLQGKQIAVVRTGVTGVENTLDSSYLFRFWLIGKN